MARVIGLLLCLALLLPGAAAAEGAPVIERLQDGNWWPVEARDDLLEVHFINVASSDCILLRMGDLTLMIDSGLQRHSDRVLAYLAQIGVERINYAFLSHPHDDHLGGYIDLFAEIPVDVLITTDELYTYDERTANRFKRVLEAQGTPVLKIVSEFVLCFGEATVTFYRWTDRYSGINDRSMVALVRYGERTALFAADIENNGQRALSRIYGEALSADILKMPHHGLASYMREFHAVVQPQLATFSNVRANIERAIGHVESHGVDWMLTTKGTIVAVTDGRTWQVWQIPRTED